MTHISADVFGRWKSLVKPVMRQKTCNYIEFFGSSARNRHTYSGGHSENNINASCTMLSGGRTERLYIFCRVTGFMSDFLSFIVVELIRFFHGALQLLFTGQKILTTTTISFCLTRLFLRTSLQVGRGHWWSPTELLEAISATFLQAGCPSCHQTNSVKALKESALKGLQYSKTVFCNNKSA